MQRFSDQLLRYSKRVVRREKFLLFNAPAEVIAKEESLIEEARKELNPVDLAKSKLAIEEEVISSIALDINSPSCGNCLGGNSLGQCVIAKEMKAFEEVLEGSSDEIQKEKASERLIEALDSRQIMADAHLKCKDYQVNDELFNAVMESSKPLISRTVEKFGVRQDQIELKLRDKMNKFAQNVLPTPPGRTH